MANLLAPSPPPLEQHKVVQALGSSHVILYSGLTLQWRTLEPVSIPKSWPHQWTVVPRSTPAPSSMHSNPPPPSLFVNLLPRLESRVNFKEYNSCFPGCYSHPHCVTWPFYLLHRYLCFRIRQSGLRPGVPHQNLWYTLCAGKSHHLRNVLTGQGRKDRIS